jgi:REP element-mobilizing transposase RayT
MPLPDGVTFADPRREIERHRKHLPHWQQDGAAYFITFRLADSLPEHLLAAWEAERAAWLMHHPQPWTPDAEQEYHERFTARLEDWLDEGHGSCLLGDSANAALLADVLRKFDGERYTHHAWVIMPNHVHLLCSLFEGRKLQAALKAWKGVSARLIHQRSGGHGRLWMEDYFDRLIRDEMHFWKCARYIRQNPVKAKLPGGSFLLHESKPVADHLDAAVG